MSDISKVEFSQADKLRVLQTTLYPKATMQSVAVAYSYCQALGLDPMLKPVHIVPMGGKDVILPGIGLYRIIAARNGCAGISAPEFGPDVTESIGGVKVTYPQWCKVTVSRQLVSGMVAEFTSLEFWKENFASSFGGKPNEMWQKRPHGQLAKCAEAQALRRACPEVGSVVTAEEMEGKEFLAQSQPAVEINETTCEVLSKQELPSCDPARFEKLLQGWKDAVFAGRANVQQIISKASEKYALTKNQIDEINAVASDFSGGEIGEIYEKTVATEEVN